MVNPQLGGISGALTVPTPLDIEAENHEETSTAVSTLLMSEQGTDINWMHPHQNVIHLHYPPYVKLMSRKRGRLGRPPGSKNRKSPKDEVIVIKQMQETNDEFREDSELSRELQQFQMGVTYK